MYKNDLYAGQNCTTVGILASRPSCPGFDSQHSQICFEEKNVDAVEVNQLRNLEESGQWLENVDQTHMLLGSGKLVPLVHFVNRVTVSSRWLFTAAKTGTGIWTHNVPTSGFLHLFPGMEVDPLASLFHLLQLFEGNQI